MAVWDDGQHDLGNLTTEEEATYRQIVTRFPSVYLTVGLPDGTVKARWVGQSVAELSGYDVEELESDPDLWLSLVHPADQERVRQACRTVQAKPVHEHYRIYRKDGQMRRVIEMCAAPTATRDDVITWMRCVIDITDTRLQAQQSISFSELVDQTPAAVVVRDPSLRLVYCNQAYADLVGVDSPDRLLGTGIEHVLSDREASWFSDKILPLLQQGPWSGESTVRRPDGKTLNVRTTVNSFKTPDGEISAYYAILTDLTEIRQTEQALREGRQLLGSILDSLAVSLAVIDSDGTIVSVNERWRSFARENGDPSLAHTCEGANYLEVCRRARGDYSEGAQEAFEGLQEVLRGGLAEFELEYPCPSSQYQRWFFMRATPLNGGRHGAVVAHIDISEHRRTEQALLASEQRYHSLVENLDAAVFRMGADLRLQTVTGRTSPLLGYSMDDFAANPDLWREVVHPDDIPNVVAMMNAARTEGTPQWMEARLRRSDGNLIWIRGALTPIFDDLGGFLYYDGLVIDITERVRAQEWERRHNRRMAVLTELSQQLASSLDHQRILDLATSKLCQILESSAAGITAEPRSGRLLRMSVCCPAQYETEQMDDLLRKGDFTMENLFGAAPVEARFVPDLHRMSDKAARLADECGLGPGMIAPVVAGEDTAGVLITGRPPGERYDEEDLWFLREVASHSSAALANAALFSRQASIAETFQRSLIPTEPTVPFLDIATFYAPAPGQTAVGGDFYDILPLDHKRALLVIGDVSGKGLQAAIHTAEAKYMLRAYAHESPDPMQIVSRLNAVLCDYLPYESFITLACFAIDAEEKAIDYINAGHETAILSCRDGIGSGEIAAGGPMLGVTTEVPYTLGRTAFAPGDTLFCYTDGLIDVRSDGERFGYYRLRDLVTGARAESSHELVQRIVDAVQGFGDAEQTDDQVIVAVRLLG